MNEDYWVIVDDNPSTLDTLVNIAKSALKTRIVPATSGEQAIDILKTLIDEGDLPVGYICDWKLWSDTSQGMNKSGVDVLAQVREASPETLRILYSAHDRDSDIIIKAIREANIHEFIKKSDMDSKPELFKEKLYQWNKLRKVKGMPVKKMKGLAECDPDFLNEDRINAVPQIVTMKRYMPELNLDNLHDPIIRAKNIFEVKRTSKIMYNVIDDKGGWIMPEQNYRRNCHYLTEVPKHDERVDELVMACNNAHSLRTRYDYVVRDLLPKLVRQKLAENGHVKIGSLGSGQGTDVLHSLSFFKDEIREHKIYAEMVDISHLAVVIGERYRDTLGFAEDTVRYFEKSFTDPHDTKFDISLVVGILCPMQDNLGKWVLNRIKHNTAPGGIMAVSSGSKLMKEQDVYGRFLMEYGSFWALCGRTKENFQYLSEKTGLELIDVVQEPMGYHLFGLFKNPG